MLKFWGVFSVLLNINSILSVFLHFKEYKYTVHVSTMFWGLFKYQTNKLGNKIVSVAAFISVSSKMEGQKTFFCLLGKEYLTHLTSSQYISSPWGSLFMLVFCPHRYIVQKSLNPKICFCVVQHSFFRLLEHNVVTLSRLVQCDDSCCSSH